MRKSNCGLKQYLKEIKLHGNITVLGLTSIQLYCRLKILCKKSILNKRHPNKRTHK